MRARIEVHLPFGQPRAWQALTDPAWLPRWQTGLVATLPRHALDGPETQGYTHTYRRNGRATEAEVTVLRAEHPHTLHLGVDHAQFHLLLTYALEPVGEHTRLSCTYDLKLKNLWLRAVLPLLRRPIAREMLTDHRRLATLTF